MYKNSSRRISTKSSKDSFKKSFSDPSETYWAISSRTSPITLSVTSAGISADIFKQLFLGITSRVSPESFHVFSKKMRRHFKKYRQVCFQAFNEEFLHRWRQKFLQKFLSADLFKKNREFLLGIPERNTRFLQSILPEFP